MRDKQQQRRISKKEKGRFKLGRGRDPHYRGQQNGGKRRKGSGKGRKKVCATSSLWKRM